MACGLLMTFPAAAQADIFRWDNGELIPGSQRFTPGPGVNLNLLNTPQRNLRFADFSGVAARHTVGLEPALRDRHGDVNGDPGAIGSPTPREWGSGLDSRLGVSPTTASAPCEQ